MKNNMLLASIIVSICAMSGLVHGANEEAGYAAFNSYNVQLVTEPSQIKLMAKHYGISLFTAVKNNLERIVGLSPFATGFAPIVSGVAAESAAWMSLYTPSLVATGVSYAASGISYAASYGAALLSFKVIAPALFIKIAYDSYHYKYTVGHTVQRYKQCEVPPRSSEDNSHSHESINFGTSQEYNASHESNRLKLFAINVLSSGKQIAVTAAKAGAVLVFLYGFAQVHKTYMPKIVSV